MRFNVIINQQKCIQYGLNQNQGALMNLFNELASWASERVINGKMYWHISRNKVMEEIPLFYTKPDTVYRAFKFLAEQNMIEYLQQNRMDFVRLTTKGKLWNKLGSKSEVGNESEQLGNESEIEVFRNSIVLQRINPVYSDSYPTYNIHNNTSNKREEKALAFLEANFPTRYEVFSMQYKSKITDFQKFEDDFHATVIIEGLKWEGNILEARAGKYARNWIENLSKQKNIGQLQQTETLKSPSGQKISFK